MCHQTDPPDHRHARLLKLLAGDAVAYVTNAGGGETRVDGPDGYQSAITAMDLPTADFSVTITQKPVDDDRI